MINEINEQQANELKQSGETFVLEVFTPTCMPCRMMLEFLKPFSEENKIYKLDATTNTHFTEEYEIHSVPTLLLFENGELKNRSKGIIGQDQIKAFIGGKE